jgi:hypothetical protein
MCLNERWIWKGDTLRAEEVGVEVYSAYPGSWWIVYDEKMWGPYGDNNILRAVRVSCTPTIDGCELSPPQWGIDAMAPGKPLAKGKRWQQISVHELPPSITKYTRDSLEPVEGCCSRFDSMPRVNWIELTHWKKFIKDRPEREGILDVEWNAHPENAYIFAHGSTLDEGFVIGEMP